MEEKNNQPLKRGLASLWQDVVSSAVVRPQLQFRLDFNNLA